MILIEENFNDLLFEAKQVDEKTKKFYIKGVFGRAEVKNQNGRSYNGKTMLMESTRLMESIASGTTLLGELDHPGTGNISLKNVSHKITKLMMNGNTLLGEAEVLEHHPNGQILKGLYLDGVKPGVSTRATGKMDARGRVDNFRLITVDAVATPSVRDAIPETLEEKLELYGRGYVIQDLAESVIHDPIAQKYFQIELRKFIETFNLRNE